VYPGLPEYLGVPPIISGTVKATKFKLCTRIHRQKPIKKFGKTGSGLRHGLTEIFRAPIYSAHRAIIFVIAQLSCFHSAKVCTEENEGMVWIAHGEILHRYLLAEYIYVNTFTV